MFSSKNQEAVKPVGQFLEPGKQEVAIHSIKIANSSTGKKALQFVFVGKKPHDAWEGLQIEKENPDAGRYEGPVAFVTNTSYLEPAKFNSGNVAQNDILNNLIYLADSAKMKDKLDTVGGATIDEYVENASKALAGTYFWVFFKAKEEEYNGKTRTKLSFGLKQSISLDPKNLEDFDPNNPYHFKKLAKAAVVDSFGSDASGAGDFNI